MSIAFAAGATFPEARAFPAGPEKLNVVAIESPLRRQFAATSPKAICRKRAPAKDATPLLEMICVPRVVAESPRCPVPAKVSPAVEEIVEIGEIGLRRPDVDVRVEARRRAAAQCHVRGTDAHAPPH